MTSRGAIWHRWEPHIHGPGTVLNDQFKNSWDDYLTALEQASPVIEAVAITDYYVTDTYELLLTEKEKGRLPQVQLLFPNIELRLDVAAKSGFVNLHLFVSPEDANHVEELKRFLSVLYFRAHGERYNCTREDLIRLGRKSDPSINNDGAALNYGATQFKVSFNELRDLYSQSDWARQNILVAVAGGATDGTSGLREAADQTIRAEIEKFAHIIFASSVAQREFWLGERGLSPSEITERYDGLKPCLHGSDAHKVGDVGLPFGDRFSWIKGGLEFDALRQACIDPAGRAYVGEEPPQSAIPSQVIDSVKMHNASWAQTPEIALNSGLVAIIGARGSGKTALADLIAAGCDSVPDEVWLNCSQSNPSFLARALSLVSEVEVELNWAAGEKSKRKLDGSSMHDHTSYPRARYLSQQFVEELCSPNDGGISDRLMNEIERVIFEAHPIGEREEAINFSELLDLKASRYRLARDREVEAVGHLSSSISIEMEKQRLIATYEAQIQQKNNLLKNYNTDRAKLVSKGSEERVKRHNEVSEAVDRRRALLRRYVNQKQTFLAMQDEVKNLRQNQAPEALRQAQARHASSGLDEKQWAEFLLDYKGNVDNALEGYVGWVDTQIANLKGQPPANVSPETPLFADEANLDETSLALLEAELARIEGLVSEDKQTQRQYAALTARIASEAAELKVLEDKLTDAKGAPERVQKLMQERDESYQRAFEAIVEEEKVLEHLYQPLMQRLNHESGTLRKLSFSVNRKADVMSWAQRAEDSLIDLRKQGEFRGRGAFAQIAEAALRKAWEHGTAEEVCQAMSGFRDTYRSDFIAHAPVIPNDREAFREWTKKFAQWLFSSDHIEISYGIEYDGVDIRKLSPGTRGIVLLLLYLALDDADDRPLIIDQPEENLDPKSVYEELVSLFIRAKGKRQVIMVTHNANLVINTDADQIIIAEAGPHSDGGLPPITYTSGGLENADIRKKVCGILEGGEEAFKERSRRLRVAMER